MDTSPVVTKRSSVLARPWAEHVGRILHGMAGLVQASSVLGGVLTMGAEYIRPREDSMGHISQELQSVNKQLKDIASSNDDVSKVNQKVAEEILSRLEAQIDDTKQDLLKIKTSVEETFLLLNDLQFKDGLETIDSAYDVFVTESESGRLKQFELYSFHLKTMVRKYLGQTKVSDYLSLVMRHGGYARASKAMDSILVTRAKILLMFVFYHLLQQEKEKVQQDFKRFTTDYQQYLDMFRKITGLQYTGSKDLAIDLPSVQINQRKNDSGTFSKQKLNNFLKAHGLLELEDLLTSRGIVVEDLLSMTEDEMMANGIQSYKFRKMLKGAVTQLQQTEGLDQDDDEVIPHGFLAQNQVEVSSLMKAGMSTSCPGPEENTTGWLDYFRAGLSSLPVRGGHWGT